MLYNIIYILFDFIPNINESHIVFIFRDSDKNCRTPVCHFKSSKYFPDFFIPPSPAEPSASSEVIPNPQEEAETTA